MSEFMKLFRRQRSVKQVVEENKESPTEEAKFFPNEKSDTNSNIDERCDMSAVSSEFYTQDSTFVSVKGEHSFKEPKGWRKSFRKLRWKKKEPAISVSSDHINLMKMASGSVDDVAHGNVHSPTKFNKRWSYSPDLCEENVPGARELRGTLERKLSIKLEVDESKYNEPSSRMARRKSKRNSNMERLQSHDSSEEFLDYHDASLSMNSYHSELNVSPSHRDNIYGKEGYIHRPLNLKGNLNLNPCLSQSQPIPCNLSSDANLSNEQNCDYDKLERYEGDFQGETNMETTDDEHTTSASGQSLSSFQPSTSGQFSEDTYTPEEDDVPYDLEDIDEVLADVESRSATLRSLHGQQGSHDDTAIQALTSSLMRGRALTKFERDAEMVLENMDYRNYEDVPVDHYYKQLNDVNDNQNNSRSDTPDTDEGHYEDTTIPTSDDNISWGSNEFDSTSDESDDNNKHRKDGKSHKAERASKEIGKEVQKLKFWERTSLKKKTSVSKAPEPEPSSFVDFHIRPERQVLPRLPETLPANLSDIQLKRRRIVGTIISSEQSYIESLQRLETDYKQTLLDHKPPIIGPDIVEKIFYKISEILQCHRLFEMALESATISWDQQEQIGGTFVASFSKSMVLQCYGDFINNFTTAMDTVRKTCIRKPQFLSFLRDKQADSKDRLNLYGLMLKPVQRFPQFILIVQDLLKQTPQTHKDRLQLQLALTELETLADRLNQRKAQDEDASDLRNLLENSNLKLTAHTKDGRLRRLVKQGDLRECEYNDDGLLEKVKDCLLVLTNDMLICCSINNSYLNMNEFERRLSQSSPGTIYDALHNTVRHISSSIRRPHQRGNMSTYKDMYKLKWRVALDVVEVMDGSPRHSKMVERETLHTDFITLQQINKLVDRLQLPHEGISSQVIDKCIGDLEIRIRQAEQHASQPEEASFTVKFPGKSDTVTRTLVSSYNSQKDDWLETISRAKLANAPGNLDSWFTSDGSENESTWIPPLFLRSLSAHMSYETLQVQCAYSFMPACHVTLLWLSCAASTVLAVVSVYYITEDRVEKVHVMQVESSVQCMEHWNPFNDSYSVWLGMESGCLLEYSADGSYRQLSDVAMPTMSTVMIMKAHLNNMYVGLLDGTLAMYTRPPGTMDLQHVSSIVVGTGPLVCLSPVDNKLWGCSGNNVVTIEMGSFSTESSRSLLMEGENFVVNLVTRVGSGLWVTFCDECNLNLYHLDSLVRLQEINLSRVIRDFVQGLDSSERISEQCHITSLWSGHSQLFVGTSNGLLLAMPLPKLPGSVPKITGPCKVCFHSLRSPLTFLFAPELPRPHVRDKTPPNPPMYDEHSPPPIPKRDDLDTTIIPDKEDSTSTLTDSQTNLNVATKSAAVPHARPAYLPVNHREAPPPPYVRNNDASPLSPIRRTATPPPRPSHTGLDDVFEAPPRPLSCDKWLENGALYENMELQSIESPRKLTFINWNEKTTRHCPVVLACGEGYRRFGSKPSKQPSNQLENHSPAILCWKVITS